MRTGHIRLLLLGLIILMAVTNTITGCLPRAELVDLHELHLRGPGMNSAQIQEYYIGSDEKYDYILHEYIGLLPDQMSKIPKEELNLDIRFPFTKKERHWVPMRILLQLELIEHSDANYIPNDSPSHP